MKTEKPVNEMKTVFPSCSANESFARAAAAAFLAQLDPTLEELNDVRTAVSEAVTNCIVHGYRDTIGQVTLILRFYEDRCVSVTVRDRGCGIPDVPLAMEPLYTTGGAERAGLGFAVMESCMDKLRVSSRPGKGTTVTMEKRLSRRLTHGG